jgi:hypothetical protein
LTLQNSWLLRRDSSLLDSVNNVKYFGGNVVNLFGSDFFANCQAGCHILSRTRFQPRDLVITLVKNSIGGIR